MNDIPKEWQLEPHYEPGLYWFSREPQSLKLLGEEIPATESEEYPGWYFLQRGDSMRIVDSLEEALATLKSRLKHWNMEDLLGRRAPIEVSGKVRKQMVIELLNTPIATPPPDYDPDRDKPLPPLLSCKWELGDYLLVASIDYTPFRSEFSTRFGRPNNPIRSLVGQVCTLSAIDLELLDEDDPEDLDDLNEDDLEPLDLLEDDEDFEQEEEEQDWEEIAVGMVSLEGNRLTVGFWSHTFDENTEVIGVAYEEASFEDKEKRYYLSPRRSHDRT
ncbi:MAG: hypothetical protein KatS3mg070_1826 [Meiothermus sp.]|uniref:hypothetical protein n=1 Tax=Meiothermus sp. TaxID=1955249 RepID=UPI0021DD0A91|nr:hypothetical protein [Meiothermus sp.]GIW28463.1 MAG: hypothetical protein KatS3mg070_1826 [Meiothermus sp.]